MREITKGYNRTPEKESLILKNNKTILKFEEQLDHEDKDDYIFTARIYTRPYDAKSAYLEGKNLEGNAPKNP